MLAACYQDVKLQQPNDVVLILSLPRPCPTSAEYQVDYISAGVFCQVYYLNQPLITPKYHPTWEADALTSRPPCLAGFSTVWGGVDREGGGGGTG